jgi:hypothetical protein
MSGSENRPGAACRPSRIPLLHTRLRWIVIGLFVAVYMGFAGAFTMTGVRWGEYPETLVYLVSGAIFIHPLLFALWAGLGPGPFLPRVSVTAFLCVLVACAEALGASRRSPRLAGWPLFDLALVATVFLLFTLVMWFVRQVSGWQIAHGGIATRCPDRPPYRIQFSVRLLLLWMTLAVCVLSLYHSRCAPGTATRVAAELWQPFGKRALLGVTVTVLGFVPTLAVPWIALASPARGWRAIVATAIAWVTFTSGVVWLRTWTRLDLFHENVKWAVFMQLGASVAGLVSALVVRSCGYRIARATK